MHKSGQHTEASRGLVSTGLVGPALCLRPPLSSLSTPRPLPASRLLGRTNGPANVSSLPPADLYYGGEAFSVEQPQAFTCPYCGRMGYTEMSLQEHVAAEHTETSTEVVGCTARHRHTHTLMIFLRPPQNVAFQSLSQPLISTRLQVLESRRADLFIDSLCCSFEGWGHGAGWVKKK